MKLQNKLVLLASLFATFGMFGCENDSDSASCGLNKEMCQSANKSFDANKCLCVDNTPTCNLTQESCQNEGKILDAVKCECVTESDGSLCPIGKHVFGNTCEDDSLQNCGQHGFDCTTMVHGWTEGECLNGACDATACTTGFHTFNHICEANTPKIAAHTTIHAVSLFPAGKPAFVKTAHARH